MPELTSCDTFESRDYYRNALASVRRKNYPEAEKMLSKALKIAPRNVLYLSHYGLCVGKNGRLDHGEEICRKAVKLSPLQSIAYVNLGKILLEQERRNEARQMFLRAYSLDNTSSKAALELSKMGIRRPAVIRFLSRSHPVNILLGKLRHKLIKFRKPELKKLR